MSHSKVSRLTQLALLSAVLILMAFTPLGYLKIGPLSITFLTIPVVIGAIVMGPGAGCLLGAIFGATSFVQCFGMDAFGVALLSIDPVLTAVLCFVPRILIGLTAALMFRALHKKGVAYPAAALTGALTNTVLFVGGLVLFFGRSEYLQSFGSTPWAIILALVSVNTVVEAVVCTLLGALLAKACTSYLQKREPYDL